MSGDGKGERSVITDFGTNPNLVAAGKQPRKRPGDSDGEAKRSRPRPSTTEAIPAAASASPAAGQSSQPGPAVAAAVAPQHKSRTKTMKLPGAVVAEARFAAGFDQSQLHSRTKNREEASTTVQVHDEVLRTKDRRLHLINAPDGSQAAAYRVLRHQVEAADNPQVIAVTSAEDGAGKTTAATNLALALAECGRAKVLLVEANFRHPSIAQMFKLTPQTCFADQVERFHSAPGKAWHVISLAACDLHLAPLARGRAPSPLLDGPAFRYAIEGLKGAGYDHIVIDCCSVLAGADVNLVQDVADGLLLVARARKTTARQTRAAIERLTPSHLLGSLLIGG